MATNSSFACEWQGIVFSLSIQSFGLHFEHSEGKKTHGMVIKWFHLVGTVIESDKEPCKLIIHHARRQTFGSAGFQDSDPIPEDTADAKRLSILKYPKLAFDQITVTFTEDKMAKKVHKLIAKSLRALGQVSGAKWHVWLNPSSGTRKSKKVWQSFDHWLDVAGISAELSETEYAGHCEQEAFEMDLTGIDMLITVSGDGMLHELINGLMRRKDWHRAMSIPISVIPAGTGNALAVSMMFPNSIAAFLAAIKRQWKPLDLMAMYQYTPYETIDGEGTESEEPLQVYKDRAFNTSTSESYTSTRLSTTESSSNANVSPTTARRSKKSRKSFKSDDSSLDLDQPLQSASPSSMSSVSPEPASPSMSKSRKRQKQTDSPSPVPSLSRESMMLGNLEKQSENLQSGEDVDNGFGLQSPRPPKPILDPNEPPTSEYPDILSPRPIPHHLVVTSAPTPAMNHLPPRSHSTSSNALDTRHHERSFSSPSARRSSSAPKPKHVPKMLSEVAKQRDQIRGAIRVPGQWNLQAYSFEAFMWGLVSDIDLETEVWRWMGDFRFYLGTVRRIAALRHYPARLLTLDAQDPLQHMHTCQMHSDKCEACKVGATIHHERYERIEQNYTHIQTNEAQDMAETAVESRKGRSKSKRGFDRLNVKQESEMAQTSGENLSAPMEADMESQTPVESPKQSKRSKRSSPDSDAIQSSSNPSEMAIQPDSPSISSPKSKRRAKRDAQSDTASDAPAEPIVENESGTPKRRTPKSKSKRHHRTESEKVGKRAFMRGLAPGLESVISFDPMTIGRATPEGWTDVTTKFTYFVASNVSHLSGDVRAAPFAHSSDASIDLAYAESIPKLKLLDLMAGSMENGRYVDNDKITYKKIKAFVLIPTGKSGAMDLDGEEYDAVPTALEVQPGAMRICVADWNLSLPA